MAWIEVHQELTRHHKVKRLARALEISRPQAVGHLFFLWSWALDHAPSGDLSGFDDEEIAEESGWDRDQPAHGPPHDSTEFVQALRDAGWLDGSDLHDWDEYAGRLLAKREANKERARKAREARTHGSHDVPATNTATVPNPTEPDRTEPNQLLQTAPTAAIGKPNKGQVPDRWPKFLADLADRDPHWRAVTVAACRKVSDSTSVSAVTTALGFAAENPPAIRTTAIGWLTRTAERVDAGLPFEAVSA